MTYQAIFTGWDDLTIEDLLVALLQIVGGDKLIIPFC